MEDTQQKDLRKEIRHLEKRLADANALIDTLQTVLRRAKNVIEPGTADYDYVFTQSARWCIEAKI